MDILEDKRIAAIQEALLKISSEIKKSFNVTFNVINHSGVTECEVVSNT